MSALCEGPVDLRRSSSARELPEATGPAPGGRKPCRDGGNEWQSTKINMPGGAKETNMCSPGVSP